jgi:hypothetical protein
MTSDALTDLLDKTEAVCKCGFGSYTQLAKHLNTPPQRVSEWVGQRTHRPSGLMTIRILNWTAKKTEQISVSNQQPNLQTRYRAAFREIQQRRGR